MPGTAQAHDYLAPIVIGVTGHRDLVDEEVEPLAERISAFYAELQRRFPDTPLLLMSALAEGADRLAARVALDAGVGVQAVLPMPAARYRDDFSTDDSKRDFDALCQRAEVIEMPTTKKQQHDIAEPGHARSLAYANAGMFISAHCHILLALWDGVPSHSLGGTSQIIYFQHYDRLPGVAESVPRSSLFLTDDESDLVYHVTCTRRDHHDPQAMAPLEVSWFTTDPDAPRMPQMPQRYTRVFARADDYNRDIRRHLERGGAPLSTESAPPATVTRAAAQRIRDHFDVADYLANHYQRQVHFALAGIYSIAVLAGLTFILYSEVAGLEPLVFPFIAFLLTGMLIGAVARRREWYRKYLDYRVLAEGLRVQYYWAIAGVHGEGHSKFAYDNFLRQRDMELGWIRNVMRVAGTLSDAQPVTMDHAGLEFAIQNWIGAPGSAGQLDYYGKQARARTRANRLTDLTSRACLWSGVAVAVVLALYVQDMQEGLQSSLSVLMGVLPLIAGVAEVYTQRKADRELAKQYRFMEHVFANARRRLGEATNDTERREVLQGLGDAALSEHAEWILVRRERQPEPTSL